MKKIFAVIMFLLTGASAYAEESILPDGYRIVPSSGPFVMVLTPYATYPVVLQDFEPKTALQVKWGLDQDEIAKEEYIDEEGTPRITGPSLAVNSKGEIYLLDAFNNRIQKYNARGEYLKSIPVYGRTDKNGKNILKTSTDTMTSSLQNEYYEGNKKYYVDAKRMYYYGKQIEFDTMDNLYYLTEKGKGWEVWKFKDDELAGKYPVKLEPGWKVDDLNKSYIDGRVYGRVIKNRTVLLKSYDIETGEIIGNKPQATNKIQRPGYTVEVVDKTNRVMKITTENKQEIILVSPDVRYTNNYYDITFPINYYHMPDGNIRVYSTDVFIGLTNIFEYNREGKLQWIFPDCMNDESGYEAKIGKTILGYDSCLANDGWDYHAYQYGDGRIIIVRRDICSVKKTDESK